MFIAFTSLILIKHQSQLQQKKFSFYFSHSLENKCLNISCELSADEILRLIFSKNWKKKIDLECHLLRIVLSIKGFCFQMAVTNCKYLGFSITEFMYLPQVFPQTGLSKSYRPRSDATMWHPIKVYTVCHSFRNFLNTRVVGKIKTQGIQNFRVNVLPHLTLKMPRKPASENVVCSCRLLTILANFSTYFLHTGKQYGPRSDCS